MSYLDFRVGVIGRSRTSMGHNNKMLSIRQIDHTPANVLGLFDDMRLPRKRRRHHAKIGQAPVLGRSRDFSRRRAQVISQLARY